MPLDFAAVAGQKEGETYVKNTCKNIWRCHRRVTPNIISNLTTLGITMTTACFYGEAFFTQTVVYTVYVCVCMFVFVVGLSGVCVEDVILQILVLCDFRRVTLSVIAIRSNAGSRNRKFFDGWADRAQWYSVHCDNVLVQRMHVAAAGAMPAVPNAVVLMFDSFGDRDEHKRLMNELVGNGSAVTKVLGGCAPPAF